MSQNRLGVHDQTRGLLNIHLSSIRLQTSDKSGRGKSGLKDYAVFRYVSCVMRAKSTLIGTFDDAPGSSPAFSVPFSVLRVMD